MRAIALLRIPHPAVHLEMKLILSNPGRSKTSEPHDGTRASTGADASTYLPRDNPVNLI